MASKIKGNTIVVKCEHLTAQRVRMTARKDITFTSQDGTVSVTVSAGETFYLAKSDSLGDGHYYLVVADLNRRTLWSCYCPSSSFNICKHEKGVQADNNARFTISPIEAHIKYTAATADQPQKGNICFGAYSFKPQNLGYASGLAQVQQARNERRARERRESANLKSNQGFSLMR